MMQNCAFCGQSLDSWDERHTHEDCITYLKEHPEGGTLFEQLGGHKILQDSLFSQESKGLRREQK